MDVKINSDMFGARPPKKNVSGAPKAEGVSFAENLRAAARSESAAARTPEAVFEQALANRSDPDFQKIDDFLEGMIQAEMKAGGY